MRSCSGARRPTQLSERGRRYVETIIESGHAAGTLVDNLLSFSQMGRASLNVLTIDMSRLVEKVRSRLMREAGDRRITWDIGALGRFRPIR